MQKRDRLAIYFTLFALIFVIAGAFMLSNTRESVTAAAVSQINKIAIGSINEQEIITEDILLKKDIGTATSVTTTVAGATSTVAGETSIATQSTVQSSTTSTSSIITGTTTISSGEISVISLIPKDAKDTYGLDQVSPDDDRNNPGIDGTVDLSNDDTRWLTSNGEYIEVKDWDTSLDGEPEILSAIASCEVDYINSKSGYIEFSYDYGIGWSDWLCPQFVSQQTTYYCELRQYGLDTASKINNVKIKCKMRNTTPGGALGFSIDAIKLDVAIR